jgi:hypothetical protein
MLQVLLLLLRLQLRPLLLPMLQRKLMQHRLLLRSMLLIFGFGHLLNNKSKLELIHL